MSDLLLVNLGMGQAREGKDPYDRTTYVMPDGYQVETALAGLALWRWLDHLGKPPDKVAFIATITAWETLEHFVESEVEACGVDAALLDPAPVEARLPRSLGDLWHDMGRIEAWVERHSAGARPVLHLDLTHGFRAIPMGHTWMARYLANRGLVDLGVMGYGVYVKGEHPTPFLDLGVLMALSDWAAAVSDFERSFDPTRLSLLLEDTRQGMWKAEQKATGGVSGRTRSALIQLGSVVKAAEGVGRTFPAGLPLELGLVVGSALESLPALDAGLVSGVVPQPVVKLISDMHERMRPLAAARLEGSSKGKQKDRLALTAEEVARQLELVARWRSVGAFSNAFEALRELVVNAVLLARLTGPVDWLEPVVRHESEGRLNACRPDQRGRQDHVAPQHREIGRYWDKVTQERNGYAHAGMKRENIDPAAAALALKELMERFNALRVAEHAEAWRLEGVTPKAGERNGG